MDFQVERIEFGEKIGLAEREAVNKYAQFLASQSLPVIFSPGHLSYITNMRIESLYAMSNSQESFYRRFEIPKKSGGRRRIDAPLPSLAHIQRWILDNILQGVALHPSAKAYRKGYSTFDNARFHRKQSIVLKVDVKNFFGSIEEHSVFSIFHDLGYSKRLSKLFSMIATLDGVLPQGAPTSGALSNIFMRAFDEKIFADCKRQGIRYTRYADDLTFSGDAIDLREHIRLVDKEFSKVGLTLNSKKTRVLFPHMRQEVTGLVVNDSVSIPQAFRRQLRQECYFIKKFGIHGHAREVNARNPRILLEEVIGKLSYVKAVHAKDPWWAKNHAIMLEVRKNLI
ncbi:MAG: RNA-directed DNA polymerase [Shimia sp.]|uniref:reverse transcriptase family protein n=1 Tax=Shimia sp. TaxID=1954381 RepID=UPI001B05F5EB|nr:reverse transcriptase family protein [Shimia sp.]MBO6899131.1 RNA-directed DNA polymerase [Shimia sp.]